MTALVYETDIVDDIDSQHAPTTPAVGNPGLVGLPLIIPGALGLGAVNTGLVSSAAAAIPILLSATALGLLLTTIWLAALQQNVNATIYGTFFGFYGSYAVLALGVTHNWFGIAAADIPEVTTLWLASWLLSITVLTVVTLRLPWLYPAVLAIVDIALVLLIIGIQAHSAPATQAAGWFIFAFVAIVIYFYVAAVWEELGGRTLPLGRPLVA